MAFTDQEIEFLRSQPLGRLATVAADGQPDVVPVAVEFDGAHFWVGGGSTVTRTRKFRNVAAGNGKVSLVFDDMPSFEPFVARGLRIDDVAEQPFGRRRWERLLAPAGTSAWPLIAGTHRSRRADPAPCRWSPGADGNAVIAMCPARSSIRIRRHRANLVFDRGTVRRHRRTRVLGGVVVRGRSSVAG